MPITGELDLHPFAPADVRSVVQEYLRACRERGIHQLRLVHGRGQGVQRTSIRQLLMEMPEVLDCRDAPPASGGWGATLVWLRPLADLNQA